MFFFLISYHEINFKKLPNSVLKEMSQRHEIKSTCLEQGNEMNEFCLKQDQGLKASAAHHYTNFLLSVPIPRFLHSLVCFSLEL